LIESVIRIHWLVLALVTLAIVGVGVALRSRDQLIRHSLAWSALSIAPGATWAALTLATLYAQGRFEPIPPASGLLLTASFVFGMYALLSMVRRWALIRKDRCVIGLTLGCGVIWVLEASIQLVCISSI